ncbi:MAG: amidohydrolase family protein [Planctomycetes bacterium]|nr:amidohydrolase family protein [Planctomycetota bacterium]
MAQLRIGARWVLPVTDSPIENGRVVIDGGRIVAVESGAKPRVADLDYGDAVILPGFVNAHTHLELTGFRGRVPFTGSFGDWLRGLIALQSAEDAEQAMSRAIAEGLRQSLAAGVTTIVDAGCGQQAADAWCEARANVVGLFEVIGMGPRAGGSHSRSVETVRRLMEQCTARAEARGSLRLGMCPHAPYSTAPEVYRQAVAYVEERDLPIGTHLAETREELEFLFRGRGPLRELLEELGLWDGSFEPPEVPPVAYAEWLGLLACRPLLAHVNYVSEQDIALLAERRCSVAYCPRTHRFFQHEPHWYRQMLGSGINVCIGTDSLASNDSLSVLDEMRFLRAADPSLDGELLLAMGTIRGARAAGLDERVGSFEPGKRADLVAVPLAASRDPVDALLRGASEPMVVYLAGEPIDPRTL